jgi:hypothetical protein
LRCLLATSWLLHVVPQSEALYFSLQFHFVLALLVDLIFLFDFMDEVDLCAVPIHALQVGVVSLVVPSRCAPNLNFLRVLLPRCCVRYLSFVLITGVHDTVYAASDVAGGGADVVLVLSLGLLVH